ncbi:hypothetical protein R3X25_05175 [Lutibacter sp. TH_r2]|uniref:hypothetical protein n=1 Tax=Lutibacter sp. TH_r2 TaxID=3082083 RepID=UPI002953FE75|nr:hypothetical protein [Lutibacter sp. TH_r2]MDV7186665.1 hypothetical protein [Lutibacter sp. TH_r2]
MKNLNLLAIVLLLALTSCSESKKSEKSSYKKYPFKSAVIEYTVSGNSTGTKTTYIADYGYKQAELSEITTNIMGMKSTEKKDVITIGSNINTIDHQTKKVITTNNPFAEKYAENVGEDYIKTGEDVLIALGFKKSGTESVLGKECTIWKGMNTIWTWKGLVLKSETNIMGMTVAETATSIKTDINVPSSKFEIPSNYSVQEAPEMEGLNDVFSEFEDAKDELTSEDKEMIKQVQNMSFEDFEKMMKKEDPEVSDEEIKTAFRMMQLLPKN